MLHINKSTNQHMTIWLYFLFQFSPWSEWSSSFYSSSTTTAPPAATPSPSLLPPTLLLVNLVSTITVLVYLFKALVVVIHLCAQFLNNKLTNHIFCLFPSRIKNAVMFNNAEWQILSKIRWIQFDICPKWMFVICVFSLLRYLLWRILYIRWV